jgi:hypothetical protein
MIWLKLREIVLNRSLSKHFQRKKRLDVSQQPLTSGASTIKNYEFVIYGKWTDFIVT